MLRAPVVTAFLLGSLGACGTTVDEDNAAPVDIANAAARAQNSVASYGNATTPAPATVRRAGQADDPAAVVGSYFRLIEAGRYDAAWALRDNGGRASGMSAADFGDGFDKFASYHAEIGRPGAVEAGAGQRYVTVPVRIEGRLREDGRPFVLAGPVTLHRVADVDGATPAQRAWRISASGLKPRPLTRPSASTTTLPDGMPATATATYSCVDGTDFVVDFDNRAATAQLRLPDTVPVPMIQQRAASGIWYAGAGYGLRGKGRDATLSRPAGDPVACTARE